MKLIFCLLSIIISTTFFSQNDQQKENDSFWYKKVVNNTVTHSKNDGGVIIPRYVLYLDSAKYWYNQSKFKRAEVCLDEIEKRLCSSNYHRLKSFYFDLRSKICYDWKNNSKLSSIFLDSALNQAYVSQDDHLIEKVRLTQIGFNVFDKNFPSDDFSINAINYHILDSSSTCYLFRTKSRIFANLDQIDSALIYLNKAYKIATKLNQEEEYYVLSEFAYCYSRNLDYKKTFSYNKKALTFAKKINKPQLKIQALNNFAISLIKENKYEKALNYLIEAYEIAAHSEFNFIKSSINQNIASIYARQGKLEKSKAIYLELLNDPLMNNDSTLVNTFLINLGSINYKMGLYKDAYQNYSQAKSWTPKHLFSKKSKLKIYEGLAKSSEKLNNNKDALYYLKKYYELNDSISKIKYSEKVKLIEAKYHNEKLALNNQLLELQIKNTKQQSAINKHLFLSLVIGLVIIILFLFLLILFHIKKNKKNQFIIGQIRNKMNASKKEANKLVNKVKQLGNEVKSKQDLITFLEENQENNNTSTLTKLLEDGIETNKKWGLFLTEFQMKNDEFCKKVNELYDFTKTDLKFIFLIKLSLNNAEISALLNVTEAAVKKAKKRIAEKLNIQASTIEKYLSIL